MSHEFWKPNKDERAAISRGDKKFKDWTDRIGKEAEQERREKRERESGDYWKVPF